VCGFVVELLYLVIQFIVKLIGKRFYNTNILELLNGLKTTEFAIISTVEVLATPAMRKALLGWFKRN
jgi:hypothetical protein